MKKKTPLPTLSTVNVLEMADGNVLSLTAYPDTKAGNAEAEKLFRDICKKNGQPDLTKSGYDTMVEDGYADDNYGWEAFLIHSV